MHIWLARRNGLAGLLQPLRHYLGAATATPCRIDCRNIYAPLGSVLLKPCIWQGDLIDVDRRKSKSGSLYYSRTDRSGFFYGGLTLST